MNYHAINPHYRPEMGSNIADGAVALLSFQWAIEASYAALNARAEARFDEACVRLSRPLLDKPLDVCEVD